MDKEKQIIDIKECIDSVYGADCAYFDVDGFAIANEIYNAGYRKVSKVAEEIFAEIEERLNSLDRRHMLCGNPKQAWGVRSAMTEIAEVKKKYTEGEG